jgi:hypothetical protein
MGTLHFLHIGKTGGSAVRYALEPIADRFDIVLHEHSTTLKDVPDHERAFFVVRDPISRFVSGFNSRLRRGRPKNNARWSLGEFLAFSYFKTPNALAEALSSSNGRERRRAEKAMSRIGHVNTRLSTWLGSRDYLLSRRQSLAYVAFDEGDIRMAGCGEASNRSRQRS